MASGNLEHRLPTLTAADGVIRIEAETLDLEGYEIETPDGSGASGDGFISLRSDDDGTGTATGVFDGEAGLYDVRLGFFDESDGQSEVTIAIDGNSAGLVFDDDLPSRLPDEASQATATTHQGIALEPGDTIEIQGLADLWEFARLDFIDFIPVDTGSDPAPTPDPAPDPAPDPDPVQGASPGYGDFEAEVLQLTNAFRADNGLDPLTVDPRLNEAAEAHSQSMAEEDFFSHTGLDGSSPGDRIEDAGYTNWSTWAENIAAGQPEPEDVMEAWINSPGHRANLLNPNLEDIGIGYVYLENDTGSVNYNHYWTQNFGAEFDMMVV